MQLCLQIDHPIQTLCVWHFHNLINSNHVGIDWENLIEHSRNSDSITSLRVYDKASIDRSLLNIISSLL